MKWLDVRALTNLAIKFIRLFYMQTNYININP